MRPYSGVDYQTHTRRERQKQVDREGAVTNMSDQIDVGEKMGRDTGRNDVMTPSHAMLLAHT